MTDAALVAEIKRSWEHWAKHLSLENWSVRFKIVKNIQANLTISVVEGGYARVTLSINPKGDMGEVLPVAHHVLHEMLHIFLDPLRSYANNHSTFISSANKTSDWSLFTEAEERAVDEITAVIWRVHEKTDCAEPV